MDTYNMSVIRLPQLYGRACLGEAATSRYIYCAQSRCKLQVVEVRYTPELVIWRLIKAKMNCLFRPAPTFVHTSFHLIFTEKRQSGTHWIDGDNSWRITHHKTYLSDIGSDYMIRK